MALWLPDECLPSSWSEDKILTGVFATIALKAGIGWNCNGSRFDQNFIWSSENWCNLFLLDFEERHFQDAWFPNGLPPALISRCRWCWPSCQQLYISSSATWWAWNPPPRCGMGPGKCCPWEYGTGQPPGSHLCGPLRCMDVALAHVASSLSIKSLCVSEKMGWSMLEPNQCKILLFT